MLTIPHLKPGFVAKHEQLSVTWIGNAVRLSNGDGTRGLVRGM